ncbi:MAG: DsbE family thiol:disulfide interchange protein [Pseudomonadota bacterium]
MSAMRKRLYFMLPALAFAIVAIAFVWALNPERDPSYVPSAMVSKASPNFDLPPLEPIGLPGLSTADLSQGEVVLVNFFASWCLPCQAEHPHLTALAAQMDIPLYGINHKDKTEHATAWLQRLGNPYDKIGVDGGRALVDWGVYGLPETFVVDGDGQIRFHFRGPLDPKTVAEKFVPLIESLRQ